MHSVWVITEDLISDAGEPSAVGFYGPWPGVTPEDVEKCKLEGDDFELFDDDGELYYKGKLIGDPLAPLHDFGIGYAGCTSIKVNGEEV